MILPWSKFALCTLVIALAGPVLVKSGERIARETGLSLTWTGVILLATATSLPELVTGISSVTLANAPNIAVADVLGSCIFNLLMLVILDEFSRPVPLFRQIDQGHILTAGFGTILIGTVGAVILLNNMGMDFRVFHISIFSPLLVILYFVAMRAGFDYQRRTNGSGSKPDERSDKALRKAIIHYVSAAGVVIAAGAWLPFVGLEIAEVMGWQTTFVGTLLIAASTSVPELVVTVTALRLKVVDMAIGGLLGSNLFDVLILAIDDALYMKGSLLASVSPAHAVTALAAVVMSGIFIVALLFRPASRIRGQISWISISLLVVYLFSAYATFLIEQ
ncbi:sodium:calcium antiporter [Alteraurantiacibacter aestuarii]|uniref:sodium:calcium antiporter n=1 Tax=Alteraurantiacibacter aestuarii TaxID=650004 RepID=UPI0031DC6B75